MHYRETDVPDLPDLSNAPESEVRRMLDVILRAQDLARDGNVMAGWQELVRGREAAEAAAAGEPWGAAVVTRLRYAQDRFTALFGADLVECGEGPLGPLE